MEGLLAVEMFVTKAGTLLVNELAPRPHNSYHATERACVTSQFEQLVRAVCDLPLGGVEVVQPAAIANLLGEVWLEANGSPAFDRALQIPGVRLHLYEKLKPRTREKDGPPERDRNARLKRRYRGCKRHWRRSSGCFAFRR